MNKHLIEFMDDELKHNGYYENIRKFAEGKEWKHILSDVVNEYEDNIDNFGPYKFMDAIEDYLNEHEDELNNVEDLSEIINKIWAQDGFEPY